MNRIQKIIENKNYISFIEKIKCYEKERRFCKHDYVHFLNVARIAMVIKLNEDLKIDKELIYSTALLHDIGRFVQYEDGTDHAIASARLAPEILEQALFNKEEIGNIVDAIKNHRNKDIEKEDNLRGVIYRADKLSRECYFCEMKDECTWKQEKKNLKLII